jgi:hypothetical protein
MVVKGEVMYDVCVVFGMVVKWWGEKWCVCCFSSPLHHPTKNNTHIISHLTPSPPYQKQHTRHISPHSFTTLPKTTHT